WQGTPGPLPEIRGFTPQHGGAGAGIEIEGAHFTGATAVRFGADDAAFVVESDAAIHATAPAGVRTGRIQVKTTYGSASSDSLFIAPPVVQTFAPGQAPVGHTISLAGYNFTRATEVRFGGVPAGFAVPTGPTVPAGGPGGPA